MTLLYLYLAKKMCQWLLYPQKTILPNSRRVQEISLSTETAEFMDTDVSHTSAAAPAVTVPKTRGAPVCAAAFDERSFCIHSYLTMSNRRKPPPAAQAAPGRIYVISLSSRKAGGVSLRLSEGSELAGFEIGLELGFIGQLAGSRSSAMPCPATGAQSVPWLGMGGWLHTRSVPNGMRSRQADAVSDFAGPGSLYSHARGGGAFLAGLQESSGHASHPYQAFCPNSWEPHVKHRTTTPHVVHAWAKQTEVPW